MHVTLTPAYGRDYRSKKAVAEALSSGADFIIQPQGAYISLPEVHLAFPGIDINVRYGKLRKVVVFRGGEVK